LSSKQQPIRPDLNYQTNMFLIAIVPCT